MLRLLGALDPYRYLIAGGLALLAFVVIVTGMYFKGYAAGAESVQVKWDADKLVMAQEIARQQAQIDQTIRVAERTTEEISNDYDRKIAEIKRYYSANRGSVVSRVCNSSAAGASQVPVVPNSAQGIDEKTADKVPAGSHTLFDDLAWSCAETTQQLISLQDWVKQQKQNNP